MFGAFPDTDHAADATAARSDTLPSITFDHSPARPGENRLCIDPDNRVADHRREDSRPTPGVLHRENSIPHAAAERNDDAVNQLWREYVATRNPSLRERLVAHYMQGHVVKVAERMKAQLPRQVDVDDLVQEGYLGLVKAIERFEPDRQVRFETFSSRRIFGAMRDYLRDLDPIPRLTRLRHKKLEAAREAFRKKHGREPDTDELRGMLRHITRRVERALSQGRPPAMVSFNSPQISAETGDDADAMGGFEDESRQTPLQRAEEDDLRKWVTQGLSRRDRLILILYYYEQMTMKDIGCTLGCSESRVSQRLESIKDCLRSRLARTGAEIEFMVK